MVYVFRGRLRLLVFSFWGECFDEQDRLIVPSLYRLCLFSGNNEGTGVLVDTVRGVYHCDGSGDDKDSPCPRSFNSFCRRAKCSRLGVHDRRG